MVHKISAKLSLKLSLKNCPRRTPQLPEIVSPYAMQSSAFTTFTVGKNNPKIVLKIVPQKLSQNIVSNSGNLLERFRENLVGTSSHVPITSGISEQH